MVETKTPRVDKDNVNRLPPGPDRILPDGTRRSTQRDYRDRLVPGLTLRVSATERAWAYVYRHAGRVRRYSIGSARDVSLVQAREIVKGKGGLASQVAAGRDPQGEKKQERHAVKAAQGRRTFEKVCDDYMKARAGTFKAKTRDAWARMLKADIVPALGKRYPEEITRGDVRELIRSIVKRGAPVSANRNYEVVRAIFSWAVSEEIVGSTPCTGLESVLSDEKPRQRVYSNDELRAIVAAAKGTEYQDVVGLILHTATRSGETRSAKWEHFDTEERKMWSIPPEDTKAGDAHPVPLSAGALAILTSIKARQEAKPSAFLFPAPTREGHLDSSSNVVEEIRGAVRVAVEDEKDRERFKVSDFGLHDLRRTVATRLAESGVAPHVIEAILGHRPPKLVRTYSVYTPLREMKLALDAWGEQLAVILAGEEAKPSKKVVAFKKGRRS